MTAATLASDSVPFRRAIDLVLRFRELGIALVLVLLVAGLTGYSTGFFATTNLNSILLDVAFLTVLALGQTIVLLTRNLDLSVGSVVGLSAMSVGLIYRGYPHVSVVWAFPIGIAVGLVPGFVNGLVVAYLRVPSIIYTLGMLSVLRGLMYLISHSRQINANEVPAGLVSVSNTTPLGVPGSTFIALALALAVGALLRGARTGRSLYAIGSNPRAAELHGLPTRRLLVLAFCLSGSLAGLAGVLFVSRFSFVQVTTGTGLELTSVAAVVVGGASIFGGSGSVTGIVLGCLLLTVIANGFAVANLSVYWQDVVYGGLIVLAVAADSKARRAGERALMRRTRAGRPR
jgi:rhamnose transport system permease protein